MERKTIKLNACLCCVNGTLFPFIKKLKQRILTISLLLLFGTISTIVSGQTVNYEYDANGNIVSKKVVQPLDATNFIIKQDSIPSFANFLAYYSPFKTVSFSELASPTSEIHAIKIPNDVNDKSSQGKTDVSTFLLFDGIKRYLSVEDKNKDHSSNKNVKL